MKPNILVIITHDTGRHFGCYGVPTVHTPAIDQLAAEGVLCANCFAAVPICCASRASMMTGRYPQSHGLLDLFFPPFGYEMHDGERHLSQLLREAGYQTHLFGIQHETGNVGRLGFDHVTAPKLPTADVVARHVAEFLRRAPARPFYAQVGFYETHSPFDFGGAQPDASRGVHVPPHLKPTPPAIELMAGIQGAIRQMDRAVAVIREALDGSGLADDTILVFTVDHGLEVPRAKWTLYDPGIEVALVARWPAGGVAGGRRCDWLLSNVDFAPTMLDLAGLSAPGNMQGRSFAAGLRDAHSLPIREKIFSLYEKTDSRCVRTRHHKLIRNARPFGAGYSSLPVDVADPSRNRATAPVELYDLTSDPLEFRNVAEQPEYAAVRRDLSERLWRWLESVDDYILRGPPETPYYRQAFADYRAWKAQH